MAEETNTFDSSKYDKYIIQNNEQQSDVVITPPTTKFDSDENKLFNY